MTKKIITVLLFVITYLIGTHSVQAVDFIPDDSGIQKIYQDGIVPHLSSDGKIIYNYSNDSIFIKGIYNVDLGQYASDWSKNHLDNTISRDTLPQIKKAGFNTVPFISGTYGFDLNDLDRINQFGLKTLAVAYSPVAVMNHSPQGPWYWPIFEASISAVMHHPALLGYYLFDEFPNGSQEGWQKIYNKLKQIDPNHVQFPLAALDFIPQNNSLTTDCKRDNVDYRSLSDIFVTDIYTIHSSTKSLLELTQKIDAAIKYCQKKEDGTLRPLILVYPTYQRTTVRSNDPNINEIMPSKEQIRGQIYAGIVHGTVGYFAYTMHSPWQWGDRISYLQQSNIMNGISPETTPDLWNEIAKVNKEIDTYNDVLLAKTSIDEYHVSHSATQISAHPLHTILKERNNDPSRYLLAVNIDQANLMGKFSFNQKILEVKSFLDNRIIDHDGSSFSDNFGEYGVHLYRIVFKNPLPGDLNHDDKVDIQDYNQLVTDFGKSGNPGWIPSDINSDGKVDIFDYNILVGNFEK